MKLSTSHRLKKFENSELRRVSGPRTNEIIENCIMRNFLIVLPKYCNGQIKEGETAGECSLHGKEKSPYKVLAAKPEGKRPP